MGIIARSDFDSVSIDRERIVVLGYGAQGRAQALNLRDSGANVAVALRTNSQRIPRALDDGITVVTPEEGIAQADLLALLIPDEAQAQVYRDQVAAQLKPGAALIFAHGYNIHYRLIEPSPDYDVILVAPSAIGDGLRERYVAGSGTAAYLAIDHDSSGRARRRMLAYAKGLGHHRAVAIETTFAEETETDLFAEQAILVGGLTAMIEAGFDTLTRAGYQPEIAYFCCLEEVKYMADVFYAKGLAGMMQGVSSTAAFGSLEAHQQFRLHTIEESFERILARIRSGEFAQHLAAEIARGAPGLHGERERLDEHPLESVRRRLRGSGSGH